MYLPAVRSPPPPSALLSGQASGEPILAPDAVDRVVRRGLRRAIDPSLLTVAPDVRPMVMVGHRAPLAVVDEHWRRTDQGAGAVAILSLGPLDSVWSVVHLAWLFGSLRRRGRGSVVFPVDREVLPCFSAVGPDGDVLLRLRNVVLEFTGSRAIAYAAGRLPHHAVQGYVHVAEARRRERQAQRLGAPLVSGAFLLRRCFRLLRGIGPHGWLTGPRLRPSGGLLSGAEAQPERTVNASATCSLRLLGRQTRQPLQLLGRWHWRWGPGSIRAR